MVNTIAALKTLWTDKMTVTMREKSRKADGSMTFTESVVITDEPCKLSFSTLSSTVQNSDAATLSQVVKVFCDKSLQIKAGSKITITRAGEVFEYSQSGKPGIFSAHQEIVLVPFEGWA